MKLKSITLQNVKGLSGFFPLGELNIITGDNSIGKTALIDGLTVGLSGFHPSLDKKHGDTFRLSSGATMLVGLDTADGPVSRTWKSKGKAGGITRDDTGPVEALAALTPALDPAAFIGANAKARLTMLSHLATGDPIDALRSLFSAWGKKLRGVTDTGDAIETAVHYREAAAALAKVHKDAASRNEKTLQTLVQQDSEARLVSSDEVTAAHTAVAEAKTRAQAARGAANGLERSAEAAESAREELEGMGELPSVTDYSEALSSASGEVSRARGVLDNVARELEAVRMEIAGHQRKMGAYQDTPAATLAERLDELDELGDPAAVRAAIGVQEGIAYKMANDIGTLTGQLGGITRGHADAVQQLGALDELEACPFCQCSGEGWKALLKDTLSNAKAIAEARRETVEAELAAAKKTRDEATTEEKRLREIEQSLYVLPAVRIAHEAASAIAMLEPRKTAAEATHVLAKQAYADAASALDELREKADEQKARAADIEHATALRKVIQDAPLTTNIDAAFEAQHEAEQAVETAERNLAEVQAAAEKGTAAKAVREQIEAAREAMTKEAEEQAKLDALKEEIASALTNAVEATYKPIIDTADTFGADVWQGKLATHEGELGLMRGPTFVPFEILSGTEKTVITAAIQASLSRGGLVIIDELSRMNGKRKQAFVHNIEKALACGALSQAVLIDHDGDFWKNSSGINVIDIDAKR